jgi:subtilisin family serine protease
MRALDLPLLFGAITGTIAFGLGCGGGDAPAGPGPAPPVNVMVIDEGFDVSVAALKDRVAATYTVSCQPPDGGVTEDDGGAGDGGTASSFAADKAALIAALAEPDRSCRLDTAIAPASNPFADLEASRTDWNAAIRGNQSIATSPVLGPLSKELATRLGATSFHGTATSGLIPQDNPGVKLVLVQESLGSPDDAMTAPTCLDQADIDRATALLADADVRAAYVQRPRATVDDALADVRSRQQIGLVNESFAHLSRQSIEFLLRAAGCPAVSLGSYFGTLGALERGFEDAHAEPGVLFVQSAGNDGAPENDPSDDVDCRLDDPHMVLVGSYDNSGVRSSFTNYGDCVDVYAPGERVIVTLPGDWLFPLDGTSFAAPLVVRLLTLRAPLPFSAVAAHQALIDLRQPDRDIARGEFPSNILYDPPAAATTGALTLGSPPVAARPRLRTPSSRALRRWLWPIRWISQGRR